MELAQRLARRQRHRLLHGYPMSSALTTGKVDRDAWYALDPSRPLLVGVLPHASCNPKVRGCGFCTFPHEAFDHERVTRTAMRVAQGIESAAALFSRHVKGVYFGGGTANLTPPRAFAPIVRALRSFDLQDAEISLEGVPRYFGLHRGALLDEVASIGSKHRISMGVQTLDPEWLRRMGRDAFGGPDEIERVVSDAHRRGFTASGDLLLNLPGPHDTLFDIRRCTAMGFDQICIYNLVLASEIDVPWVSLLETMPRNDVAFETWRSARALLLEEGFTQTTLTNFERGSTRFVYERASFDPSAHDAVGFGPSAISTFVAKDRGIKWMNGVDDRVFFYRPRDLRLLFVTRNLSSLRIERETYARFFGTTVEDDFAPELEDIRAHALMNDALELTERGMFFADAVAGHLADARVRILRGNEPNTTHDFMG